MLEFQPGMGKEVASCTLATPVEVQHVPCAAGSEIGALAGDERMREVRPRPRLRRGRRCVLVRVPLGTRPIPTQAKRCLSARQGQSTADGGRLPGTQMRDLRLLKAGKTATVASTPLAIW
jgi:hypothetical protein